MSPENTPNTLRNRTFFIGDLPSATARALRSMRLIFRLSLAKRFADHCYTTLRSRAFFPVPIKRVDSKT